MILEQIETNQYEFVLFFGVIKNEKIQTIN